ncbi:MAG TPA: hypothetical protein VFM80_10660 [Gracilimonas sp.]|uniref:hypothetical protein n=1 Tax=Gracilimonas sp. TaxID=1974203 RepID=UPI002DA87F7B|nr:hypothetical protein [Gracilimonas sp.]
MGIEIDQIRDHPLIRLIRGSNIHIGAVYDLNSGTTDPPLNLRKAGEVFGELVVGCSKKINKRRSLDLLGYKQPNHFNNH